MLLGGVWKVAAGVAGPWLYAGQGSQGLGGALVFMVLLGLGGVAIALGVFDLIAGIVTLSKAARGTGSRALCIISAVLGLLVYGAVAFLGMLLALDQSEGASIMLASSFSGMAVNVYLLVIVPRAPSIDALRGPAAR